VFLQAFRPRAHPVDPSGPAEYRGGRLAAPLIDPEMGCAPEEMGEIKVQRPVQPVKLTTPDWAGGSSFPAID